MAFTLLVGSLMMHAVFAVDPGESTGLAWGIFPTLKATFTEQLLGLRGGSKTVDGTYLEQGRKIGDRWSSLRAAWHCDYELPLARIHLVIEDFILTSFGSSEREGILPCYIIGALMGYRLGQAVTYERCGIGPAAPVEAHFQLPSQKGFATDARLKTWGLYRKGQPHENDAWRHLAVFAAEKCKR